MVEGMTANPTGSKAVADLVNVSNDKSTKKAANSCTTQESHSSRMF
jgi:hypothetical protein